jgi:SWI/SNF-related matrix-associated actin-dependent regulator 1 of chromatin subfamily A
MESGKVQYLKQVLPEMRNKGDKILLFSQFVIILDILELVMDTLGMKFLRLDGSTPGNERMDLIDEYNNNSDVTVFLLSTKACGLGINLTSANVCMILISIHIMITKQKIELIGLVRNDLLK